MKQQKVQVSLLSDEQKQQAKRMYEDDTMSINQIAKRLGVWPNKIARLIDDGYICNKRSRLEALKLANRKLSIKNGRWSSAYEDLISNKYDDICVDYNSNHLSYSEIRKKYRVQLGILCKLAQMGRIKVRTAEESCRLRPIMRTEEQRMNLSNHAKRRRLGGYREKAGRSQKFWVADSYGKTVCLQSTFELRCANVLNALQIKWIRPSYLKYGNKKYFPDFFLIDFNMYLDPKNNFKYKQDRCKIDTVISENNVRVEVILEHQLTEDYIQQLLGI